MIDKFLSKFKEFNEHEAVSDLADNARVQLFGLYIQAFGQPKPSVPAPKSTSAPARSGKMVHKPNKPATEKQINFLKRLVREGRIDEAPDYQDLTRGQASALISIGVKNEKKQPPQEEEPQGEFTGSFTHQSGGLESSGHFWE
jgi:hypothetical protein